MKTSKDKRHRQNQERKTKVMSGRGEVVRIILPGMGTTARSVELIHSPSRTKDQELHSSHIHPRPVGSEVILSSVVGRGEPIER